MASTKEPVVVPSPPLGVHGPARTAAFAERIDALTGLLKKQMVRLAIVIAILGGVRIAASLPSYVAASLTHTVLMLTNSRMP
jgi:hypothetical protein